MALMSAVDNQPGLDISTNIDAMEKLWAKELYELGAEDRERINDELHGVTASEKKSNPEEGWTEKQYLFYLEKFQTEIDTKIPFEDKQSYQKGLELGSSYIMSSDHRLRFLRAERYNVEKAAIRYCKCLDFLVGFFGEYTLMRPLLMTDLTKREVKFLREGFVQILPTRDIQGRRIFAQLGSYGGNRYTELEKFRVSVYLCFTVLAGDVTTQRLGVVSIASFTRGAEEFIREEALTIRHFIKQFFAGVPVRWSAAHMCIPDGPMFHVLKALMLFLIGSRGRSMLRIHTGTPMECDYTLRSFGIPTDDIPRTSTHTIKTKNHNRLITVRKVIDAYVEKVAASNEFADFRFPGIECPEINCVLFGRYAWDHRGNIEFRGLLRETFADIGLDVDISEKMQSMIQDVMEKSRSRGFRFLMYDRKSFLYKEVTKYEEVWALVDQSLREFRKRSRAKRMIEETKLVIRRRDMNRYSDGEDSNISTSSFMGEERNNRGKFMKDCNGCRCSAFE